MGQFVWLCGPSGAGKSTLCGLIAGRYDDTGGEISNPEGVTLGYVAQDYENQLLGATVGQELEIGRRGGRGEGPEPPAFLLSLFESRLNEDPHHLSCGLQQLLLVTSLVLSRAGFLILDESLSLLDTLTQCRVLEALQGVCAQGVTVLLVSHDLRVLPYVDRVVGLSKGQIRFDVPAGELSWNQLDEVEVWSGTLQGGRDGHVLSGQLQGELPSVALSEGAVHKLGPGLEVGEGQATALVGISGAGKSRALSTLCGLDELAGWRDCPLPRALLRQRAEASLFHRQVQEELQASLTVASGLGGREHQVPQPWLKRSPRHLSNGQARFLAATCLLLQGPPLLLLDDPFAGLDRDLRTRLWNHLQSYLESGGTCLLSTHHADELVLYTSRTAWLRESVVHWQGATADFEWQGEPPTGLPLALHPKFTQSHRS